MKASMNISFRLNRIQRRIAAAFMLASFLPTAALALPVAPQVVSGSAAITTSGSAMTVTNSANAIINWQGFSINQGESTRFIQPSAASAVLNRITGGDASRILGLLQSNGKVLLINPNGILFGPDSRVDVNGLIASSLGISNQDFLAGKMNFSAGPVAGKVENQGTITVPGGGQVYLIAPDVANSGIITAPNGDILLVAGKEVLLVDKNNPEIALVVSAPEHQALNLGTLASDAGRIGVYGGIVRQKGRISADSAVMEGGRIFLKATKSIELADSSVISADGAKGGRIVVKTEEYGKISGTLTARGTISAQGDGSKDSGGFVETSAKIADINSVKVNTRGGRWLLDPDDVEISSTPTIAGATLVTPGIIQDALANNDFIVQTDAGGTGGNGDIFVNDTVSWSTNNTLTLSAVRNISVNFNITASGNSAGLNLYYGGTDGTTAPAGGANYSLNNGAAITLSGTNPSLKIGNQAYTVINSLGVASSTTTSDLQGMTGNLAGNYALGSNIDATGTGSWNSNGSGGFYGFLPVGNSSDTFNGTFDGLGHTITGLTINRPTTDYVGLFGEIGGSSSIRNVGLVGGSVIGQAVVGGLLGKNDGTVSNSYSTGPVTGIGVNTAIGGLTGINSGSISGSYATGNATGVNTVGGLVGTNWGSISNSYSIGNVIGVNSVGGLAGINGAGGILSNVHATGNVTGSGDTVGGLVGFMSDNNQGMATTINNAYSSGTVSGVKNVGGLVGWYTGTLSSITSAHTTGNVTGSGDNVGGLVGRSDSGAINTVYATGDVSGVNYVGGLIGSSGGTLSNVNGSNNVSGVSIVGGLVGYNAGAISNASYSIGTVAGSGAGSNNVGGLAGANSGTLSNVYSTANVSGVNGVGGLVGNNWGSVTDSYSTGNVLGVGTIGGLAGSNGAGGTLRNVYATGNVAGSGDVVGGLVGFMTDNGQGLDTTISSAYSSGTVNGVNRVGGLVGWVAGVNSSISNAYSTGSVSGNANVGGLAGQNDSTATIRESYATGSVSGTTDVGGLVGGNSGTITNSYWDTVTSGQTDLFDGRGTGLTTEQMKQLSSFGGWNIANTGGSGATWRIYEGHTAPLLTSFMTPLTLAGAPDVSVTYSGAPQSGAPITLVDNVAGAAATGTNVGFYNGYFSNQQGYDIIGGNLTITARPLSTWIGSSDGLWSNAANWDVMPVGNNVLAVSIPSGSGTVTYNADAGMTHLQTLTSAQTLALSGGTLDIGNLLTTTGYQQTGGSLTGTGSLTVTNNFSQTAGNIVLGGTATLNQAAGNLGVGSISASSIGLTAVGAITQSGPLVTTSLTTQSAGGTTLAGPGNHIGAFTASNSVGGNITLTNTATRLLISGISQLGGGNVAVTNTGSIDLNGDVLTTGGIEIHASGDVAQYAGNIANTIVGSITPGSNDIIISGQNVMLSSVASQRDIDVTAQSLSVGNIQALGSQGFHVDDQ